MPLQLSFGNSLNDGECTRPLFGLVFPLKPESDVIEFRVAIDFGPIAAGRLHNR